MSKVFCDKPFNHNYIHMNGKMRLCCTTIQNIPSDNSYTLFDAGHHTIEEYWNSDRMKEIRKNMIAGIETLDCQRYYCVGNVRAGCRYIRHTDTIRLNCRCPRGN